MKLVKKMTAFAVTVLALAACQKETKLFTPEETAAGKTEQINVQSEDEDDNLRGGHKKVYTLNNAVSGNAVIVYDRASNGTLTFNDAYTTGGTGTGGGLGNQGALFMSDDDDILLAVNPGSNSISSFKIRDNGLQLRSTVSSGGMRPVSITQHDDIVFVLNGGGTNNISGFRLTGNGMLQAIPNSTRPLSAAGTGPAQVSFVNDGKVLVITEKATNKITTYAVNGNGIPGMMRSITSSSPTPFGFADGKHGNIFVSEAVGGAPGASVLSSYRVGDNGSINLVNGSVGAGQSAACWVVLTNNGKYAYATNTASNNISSFAVNNSGNVQVAEAIAVTTMAGPIDAALSNNSKFLYVLNGGGHSIQGYRVENNGTLNFIQTVTGLPAGATGLVAR